MSTIPTIEEFGGLDHAALVALDPATRMHIINDLALRTQAGDEFSLQVRTNVIRLMQISRHAKSAANPRAKPAAKQAATASLSDLAI